MLILQREKEDSQGRVLRAIFFTNLSEETVVRVVAMTTTILSAQSKIKVHIKTLALTLILNLTKTLTLNLVQTLKVILTINFEFTRGSARTQAPREKQSLYTK